MPPTPFIVGQWVRGDRFYGRTALIEEILQGDRNWLWVLGTRRIGKTSLLRQIESLTAPAGSGWLPLFWDFQGANDTPHLHRGFREALLDAEETLERAGIDRAALAGEDVFESLGRLRRSLRASGLRLMLLCDEVEELIAVDRKDPDALPRLRHAMLSQADMRTVMVATIRLFELADSRGDTSPFLHGFAPPVTIGRLADEEARALVRQDHLPPALRPSFPAEVVEEIRTRCDNHPYLMQLVCKRHHEIRDLTEAVEQVATDPMVSYFFAADFAMLTAGERDAIRILSDCRAADSNSIQGRLSIEPDSMRGILHRLEQLGYVRRNEDRRFELANEFFRRWFRERARGEPAAKAGTGGGSDAPHIGDISTQVGGTEPGLFDGRYELIQRIGSGAMGVVYKALDRTLRETIAIKVLSPEHGESPEFLERFRMEILLARDIGHPNILRVYHLGECRGSRYLTMQWIAGPTLAEVIKKEGPLPVARIIDLSTKIASALQAAHALKIIHRDVKSQNILIDDRDEPRLSDFGIARLSGAPGSTKAGSFIGTPYYASPEQADSRPLDDRSDIYSLGVVIFEMATGRRPFHADSVQEILEMHRKTPPPDPSTLRPDLPQALADLIRRCLEKEPARRYPSSRALREALEALHPRSSA